MNQLKRIFLFSALSAAPISHAKVLPILPNEGMWNVTTRIGIELDALLCQQKCDVLIQRTDIGSGGIYTITTGNTYYCLAQSVTITSGAVITIDANNVTLDLNGHIIDGGNNGVYGVVLNDGVQNVTIKNGIIQNININGEAILGNFIANQLQNVVIQDIAIHNSFGGAIFFGNSSLDVGAMLIENCQTYNGGRIAARAASFVMQGCTMYQSNTSVFVPISVGGQNILIQDCIVTVSNGSPVPNIEIVGAQTGVIRNCITQSNQNSGGFLVESCHNTVISDCIAQGAQPDNTNSVFGFWAIPGTNLSIERCVASGYLHGFYLENGNSSFSAIKLVDCVAERNINNGFWLLQQSTSQLSNIILKRCCATANGANGFLVSIFTILDGPISPLIFEDCVSQDNNGDGFSLFSDQALVIENVVFRGCVAQRNQGGTSGGVTYLGDGFGIGTAAGNACSITDVIFQDCLAQKNVMHGFDFGTTTTKIKIINCCAMMNTGTGINNQAGDNNYVLGNSSILNAIDYSGVTDPNKIASSTYAGALLGAGRWVNAKT